MASQFTRKIIGTNHEKEPKSTSELGDLLIDNDGKVFIHTMTANGKGEEYTPINRDNDIRIGDSEDALSLTGISPAHGDENNHYNVMVGTQDGQAAISYGDTAGNSVVISGVPGDYNLNKFTLTRPANYAFLGDSWEFDYGGIVLQNFLNNNDESEPDYYYSGHVGLTAKIDLVTGDNVLIINKFDDNANLFSDDTQPQIGTINGAFTNFNLVDKGDTLVIELGDDIFIKTGDKIAIYIQFTLNLAETSGKE